MPDNAVTLRVKAIQRRLGVKDDGLIGPVTLTALERVLDKVFSPDAGPGHYSLTVSRKSVEQLIGFEISSDAYYRSILSYPSWPEGYSGITIGIGYDLGYNTKEEIEQDWHGWISDANLAKLTEVSGLTGEDAKKALDSVNMIEIPLEAAKAVFYGRTLSKYAEMTQKAYPGIEQLPADAQGMLLSLVYNRGTSMSGSRRKEMKAIQSLVRDKDLKGIAGQIRAMKRLWEDSSLPGLLKRRDLEAEMVENARRVYEEQELIQV